MQYYKSPRYRRHGYELVSHFLFLQRVADIDAVVQTRRDSCKKRGITLQPQLFVAGAGGDDNVYVVKIEQLTWVFQKVVRAIDVALKSHFVFDLQYQYETANAFIFLQRQLYKIQLPTDKLGTKLRSFINDLKYTVA